MVSFDDCVFCLEKVREFCNYHYCDECPLVHICCVDIISEPAFWSLERS